MKAMKTIMAAMAASIAFTGCDVHEFPAVPETRPHVLRLHYETDLPVWNVDYSLSGGMTSNGEAVTRSEQERGQMRYVIRTYPLLDGDRPVNLHTQEFVFTRSLAEGYDSEFTLDLIPGDYRLMVWSDMSRNTSDTPYYNYTDFTRIHLQGAHAGNTDYRDAFRGWSDISIDNTIQEVEADTTAVVMNRPLAKFEFMSTDLKEFIEMEIRSAMSKAEAAGEEFDPATKIIDIADYRVKVIYPAFMPNTYSLFSDKPVDSTTGVSFDSSITQVSETDGSMGFDYVFVGDRQSAVTVQLAIFNKDGEQVSLTVPVDVPLKRGYHTLLRGTFLTQRASGGIGINPEFNGDHNIIL